MRTRTVWVGVVAVALVASAIAQQGQPQRQRGGQFGQGPGFGRMMGGGAMVASMLLARPDVQRELNLTEQQKAKINEMQQAQRLAMQELRNLPPEERRQRMQEIRQKNDPTTVLNDTQKKRLRELELQWTGPVALMNPEVAKEVGLTTEQQSKIQGIIQEQMQAMREQFQGGGQPGANFQQMREQVEKRILEVLTPAQRQKWQEMLGKPFQFEGGRGFGPGFGRPRQGGGQQRGGQGFGR